MITNHSSTTRIIASELWRIVRLYPDNRLLAQYQSLADCLKWAIQANGDDRALTQQAKEWRGRGNRLARRLGWGLKKWYCHHMDGGYDCCCEPQSGYYYEAK